MNTQSIAEARALLDEFEAQMDKTLKLNYSMSNKVYG